MKLSDALSRPSNDSTDAVNKTEIKGLNVSLHEVGTDISEQKLNNIHEETQKDDTMQILIRHILEDPRVKKKCPDSIKEFYSFYYELSLIDGLVLKGTSTIIIQEKLRQNALIKLHVSHLGTGKTTVRARTCVFWDIKQLCERCEICNKFSATKPSESLRNDLVCTKPWDTLACNLFEFHEKLFLIIVDRNSKFVCMEPVVDHTADKMILAFLNIFSKLGIPNKI